MPRPAAYSDFQVGGAPQPITTAGGNTLLQDADPAGFYALDFWKFVIETYPGPRLLAALQAAGIKDSTGNAIADVVQTVIPYDPIPQMLQAQFRLPLLAWWRKAIVYNQYTTSYYYDRCSWDLLYVLPPLLASQAEQVVPGLRAVEAALRYKTMFGFDPNYTPPGGSAGQCPWAAPFANVMAVGLERGEHGYLEDTGDTVFPCIRMQGYFDERDMYVSTGPGPFTGADIDGQLVAPDGTILDSFVVASTEPAPTISSLSATTGTHTGGTSVHVIGTGFQPGPPGPPGLPMVYFGGVAAVGVQYISSTQINCTTPAMQGAGVVPVILINADGQSATLLNAFTFT